VPLPLFKEPFSVCAVLNANGFNSYYFVKIKIKNKNKKKNRKKQTSDRGCSGIGSNKNIFFSHYYRRAVYGMNV
jgi:hypothetical protein